MTRRSTALALAAALLVAGCRGETPAPGSPEGFSDLTPIPHPALSPLEDIVREEIEARRRDLDGLLQDPSESAGSLAESFGEMGRWYLAYSFEKAASACFHNALALGSERFRWPYFLGVALEEAGDLPGAASALERALRLRPACLPCRLRLGRIELEIGEPERAREWFGEALRIDEESAAARYGLGRAALAQKDPETAVTQLSEALERAPEAAAIRHVLGLAYRDLGRFDLAQTHLALGGSRRPRFEDPLVEGLGELLRGARVHRALGVRARRAGRLEEATAHLRRAAELDPESAADLNDLASVLGEAGQHEEALAHLERAVRLDPDHRDAHFNLATAYSRLGRLEEAIEALSRVLEIDPGDRQARFRRARVYDTLGRPAPAIRDLEALTEGPESLEASLLLASIQLDARSFAAALATLESALAVLPGDLDLADLLANVLAACPEPALRDPRRALEVARSVFEKDRSLEHAETVALALAANGRLAEAVRWQRDLLEQAREAGAREEILDRLGRRLQAYEKGVTGPPPWGSGIR